jgi:hypothetical protein
MRVCALAFITALASSAALAQDAAPSPFEGPWGYVDQEPADSRWGAGLSEGQGACGGPKQLDIDIRDETFEGAPERRLRLHRDQPLGALVTSEDDKRITTVFLGDADTFELRGDSTLTIVHGGTTITFERCH